MAHEAAGGDEGAWIFVSHSHQDLDEVRRVRDALEAMGHNPLLFFLKCLDDDSELDDLIRREINAREIFLLCDSPNARTSDWVKDERTVIERLSGRLERVVDLKADWAQQLSDIKEWSRLSTVFISYARVDRRIAEDIAVALHRHDYKVAEFDDLNPGQSWVSGIKDLIDRSIAHGIFLVLLSPEALHNKLVLEETVYALGRCADEGLEGKVIPVVVGDFDATLSLIQSSPQWNDGIGQMHLLEMRKDGSFEPGLARLVRIMRAGPSPKVPI
jgi:hypothetical protein